MSLALSKSHEASAFALDAINRLANAQDKETMRITTELTITHVPSTLQKIFSCVCCPCCCSDKKFRRKTNIEHVQSSLKSALKDVFDSNNFERSKNLQEKCKKAILVFNQVVQHSDTSRKGSLDYLMLDMDVLRKEMTKESPLTLPQYPQNLDGTIDYKTLLCPPSPASTSDSDSSPSRQSSSSQPPRD